MKSRKVRRKAFFLLAMLLCSGMASAQVRVKGNVYGGCELGKVTQSANVTINNGTMEGSVYGGGMGSTDDKNSGLVKGNTAVTMDGGVVQRSIYGGGELGSVGTFTEEYSQNDTVGYNVHFQGEPKTCAPNTGLAKVLIRGGRIGEERPKMPTPDSDDDFGYVFCGSRGALSNDSIANLLAVVNNTILEISGTPLITASVYGGSENGMVLGNTSVKISGGQIGMGYYKDSEGEHWDQPYSETKWNDIITSLHNGTLTNDDIQGTDDPNFNGFHQCDSWPYRYPYSVYDIYANDYESENSNAEKGLNGQTFYGNVFGGGSGYYPVAPGIWRRAAGRVNGDTYVEISGGHILSSVYGGNENTDVMGTCTLKMSGGTVGVPRVADSIKSHPVLCYLYGAGKGDQRTMFNTWTNVDSTHVEITGGTIFGSALGGGEDGHVLRNVSFTINEDDSNTTIGTWGYSGYDGNVFGAGRGFSGDALTAGNVGGNIDMTIKSGLILGNVFGGGRNASVGPKLRTPDDILYGQMQPDDANGTHGHINVTITGGTIGNDYESKLHHYDTIKGGNVFGGSMGAIVLLDGTTVNDMWPRMSRVKTTHITIKEADNGTNPTIIKGSVYGGGMFGTVADSTSVDIQGGTIWRDVFGGGYGSDLNDEEYKKENKYLEDDGSITSVMVTPRRRAGRVEGNTKVRMSDGWVKRNVYGGGKLASVGTITNEVTVQSDSDSLSISWPLRLFYKENTGADTVLIKGGRIGITGNDFMGPWQADGTPLIKYNGEYIPYDPNGTGHNDSLIAACEANGEVYGGGKGEAGDRREMAELADCVKTVVTVNYDPISSNTATASNFKPSGFVSDFYSTYNDFTIGGTNYGTKGCVVSNLYGAAENGHTHDSTYVTLTNGLIGGNLFGGGKGKDVYSDSLRVVDNSTLGYHVERDTLVHSISAGKVYGNTYVNMNGGHVLGNVYGGGELASVGKGNYLGYGETLGSEATSDSANFVLKSGKCYVTINDGTIGTSTFDEYSGHVYGSSKGMTFPSNNKSPRYKYSRDFFLGYSNFTYVTIGGNAGDGPTIYGSVFGGGENGHVRFNSEVTVNRGTIGVPFNDDYANITNPEWAYRGNVYGAGRGQDKIAGTDDYCNSAGSVTLNTTVTVNGGTIHRNVYGGGSLASVGPPPTGYNPGTSLCKVNIKGGIIGETVTPTDPDEDPFNYGGDIFGAGRGIIDAHAPLAQFATASYTEVNIDSLRNGNSVVSSAHVIGNVYGGGEIGQVNNDASVNVSYGIAEGSVYGGGKGLETEEKAALVLGNTYVEMRGGTVERSVYGGGQLGSVGTFTVYDTVVYTHGNTNPADNDTVYVPKTCKKGTGLAQVVVSGGSVGLQGSLMPWEDHNPDDDDRGWIFCGSQGLADSILYYRAVALGVCDSTYLEIKNTTSGATIVRPLITASVYGGSENGLVLGNTHVKIAGGQIGSGHYKVGETHHFDPIYDEDKWTAAINAINNGTIETALATGGTLYNYFHECDAWDYTTPYLIYDIEAAETGHPNNISGNLDYQTSSATAGTNGHSFFGNVFGGGSGYYPITTGVWRRTAGQVNGNTYVEITGGHILTAVYGGNETTDVLGKCTVEMSDGTIGIPRTKAQIAARPVNGYLYGAGMGDPRNLMNTYNNVDSTIVQITDGTIFGSVFGGSKEGHVLDSTKVVVDGGLIGTTGFSGYDGHVFGGGKGKDILLVADTLNGRRQFPVGRVGGNTHVTMKNGTVLGNLYGGGQVGLVGVDETGWIDVQEVYDAAHHGLAKVDVVGGTIGNPVNNGRDLLLSDQKAGNVYGGGRGNLNEFREDDLGRVAKSVVNISSSPTIYGSVFGGGQMANVGYWVSYEVGYAEGTSLTQVNIEGTPEIGTDYEFSKQYANNTVTPPKWTQYDTISGMRMINHTLTGNVYGGGQGKIKLDNHGYVVGLEHGHCGSAEVNISGNPTILSSVFGGAEEGAVWGDTKVNISGGTIGKTGIKYDSLKYVNNQWVHDHDSTYSFGSVFGGSYGADSYAYTASPNGHVKDSINGLAGRVYGNATVAITGGTIRGNVFGGGDMASVGEWTSDFVPVANTGKTTVSIGGEALIGPLDGTGLNAYVFGGGKGFSKDPDELRKAYANVDSTFVIVSGGKIRGSVFGGGNDAHVLGSASVKVHAGADIGTDGLTTWDGNIFGGGRNFVNSNHSNGRVAGNIDIVMDGGAIQGSIFGGGRLALSGVNLHGEFPDDNSNWPVANHGNVTINVSGGSIGNNSDQGIHLLTGSDESVGDIFGSGKGDTRKVQDTLSGRVTNATICVSDSARVYGSVFGGGEMASLGWWSPTDHAFYPNTGRAVITIGRTGEMKHPEIGTNLELNAAYLCDQLSVPHSDWTIFDSVNGQRRLVHTCTGNVFGGSQGDVDFEGWIDSNPNTWNNWPYMGRSRTATITVNSGTIMSDVFGGSEQGTMDDTTHIIINGGTIGSLVTALNGDKYYHGGVYGGGYGSDEANEHDHPITVYGESTTAKMVAGRVYGNTRVDVYGGIIQGDVYGGASFAYVGGEEGSNTGNVLVNIGKESQMTHDDQGPTFRSIQGGNSRTGGSVYGANNRAGTPYGNVMVNVISTAHTEDNQYPAFAEGAVVTPSCLDTLPHAVDNFAIFQVYGGSNKADYLPYEGKADTVHVWYCKENTIYDVYGGCNAASIGSTTNRPINSNVFIDGGRIFRVFGGGNGSGGVSADIHGTATTEIEGGVINQVFGGSNSLGQIEEVNLLVEDGGTCNLVIGDGFGGGNNADIYGDVVTNIECGAGSYQNFYGGANFANIYGNVTVNVFGGTFDNLFAGSKGCTAADQIPEYPEGKSADILDNPRTEDKEEGNVTLNIFGGNIYDAAYGGSDANGRIEGKIQVNVFNAGGTCGINLDTVFGAGRATKYEPFYTINEGEKRLTPEVNVIHGTVKGCVFGGGKGVTATTTANPVVNIGYNAVSMGDPNMDETLINTLFDTIQVHYCLGHWDAPSPYASYVNGNVYGGGEEGMVDGTTTVNVYEGTIGTIEYTKSNPEGSYDGINHLTGGNVFGGGKGCVDDFNHGRVKKDANVNIKGGHVLYNVYGGGEIASVGEREPVYEDPEDPTSNIIDYKPKANTGKTTVTVTGGQVGPAPRTDAGYNIPIGLNGIDGYVFGGSKGQVAEQFGSTEYIDFSDVNETEVIVEIPSNADITTNRIWGSVFGGAEDGHVLGNAVVRYLTGTMGTKGTTSYDGNIFGGGRNYSHNTKTAGRVRGNITVTMSNGNILGNIYGGGRSGATGFDYFGEMIADNEDNEYGHITVNVNGGIVGTNVDTVTIGNVFGGGMGIYFEQGVPVMNARYYGLSKETSVSISNARIYNSVYGGGQIANVEGNANVTITGSNTIIGSSAGTPNTDDYYQFGSVYGGGKGYRGTNDDWSNAPGTVFGNTFVTMTDGQVMGNVFGGGEVGSVGKEEAGAIVDGTGQATVTISGGEVGPLDGTGMNANVYGGGRGVDNDTRNLYKNHAFVKNTEVTITEDAQIDGSVFGGAAVGHVLEDANVHFTGGIIGTTGLTGWDGHIFGGGQGDGWLEIFGSGDDADTVFHVIKHAGRVGGNTKIEMESGTALGCLYGGGKLALTGVDVNGEYDTYVDDDTHEYDSINHGLAVIEVTGTSLIEPSQSNLEVDTTTYYTCIGITDVRAMLQSDYSMGDIFGGGQGDFDYFQDVLAGRVANTDITISGSSRIYCSVFGGGELASVGYWGDDGEFVKKTGTTKVTIEDSPVIGSPFEFTHEYLHAPEEWTFMDTINGVSRISHSCTGNVFGACQGDVDLDEDPITIYGLDLAHSRTSEVNISGNPVIMGSVFGGGEQGSMSEDSHVNISGGTIGTAGIMADSLNAATNQWVAANNTYNFGSVFGGSYGMNSYFHLNSDDPDVADTVNSLAGRIYGNTYVNITGGTIYENVYGGGNMASVGAVDTVKVSGTMIDFAPHEGGHTTVSVSGSTVVGPLDGSGQNGYVYGGGKGIGNDPNNLYERFSNVNSTEVIVNLNSSGRVYGSLYGGGSDCHVLGNTSVTLNSGVIGTYDAVHNTITDWGGNIFGGGRNFLRTSYSPGRVAGNTNVEMNGGTIYGAIFGGGRNAVTGTGLDGMNMRDGDDHGKTTVKVKGGTVGYEPLVPTFISRPIGEVYGAGKGTMEGISGQPAVSPLFIALVKNTEVEISQAKSDVHTHVLGAVYGGGEVGNVGHYIWNPLEGTISINPDNSVENTGVTQVTVKGGRIGLPRSEMSFVLVGGDGPDKYNPATNATGNVFGGGKGLSVDPATYGTNNISTVQFGDKYLLDLMASSDSTNVTIINDTIDEGGVQVVRKPWVKGSVYGGSASGHVLGNTEVTIAGGQIGAGDSGTTDIDPYDDDQFVDASSINLDDPANSNKVLKGTFHWTYDPNTLNPFDVVAIYNGIVGGVYTYIPTDGKTWFGNVYGGGSGFLPYIKRNTVTNKDECVWNPESGKVYGNTTVNITGGHILSSVYGGCEISDVGSYTYNSATNEYVHVSGTGKATVTMSGGTVGVPRTTTQIEAHPVPGYVFGAGKGESRENFNTYTNVDTTLVTICDSAMVYGSVLGGAEQGHVIGKANVLVKKTDKSTKTPVIGSTGFSGYDGHVFGGGWGDKSKFVSTPALTYNCPAGRVGGTTHVEMLNGKVLGNIYGGGYVARVGVGVGGNYESFISIVNEGEEEEHREYDSINHGVAMVDVKGGIIGNHFNDGVDMLLNDQKVGNVYGGGRGSAEEYHEDDLGRVAKAIVNITSEGANKPMIYGSVFGGGQMANVGHWNNYESWYTKGTGATYVNITGAPTIGTEIEFDLHYTNENNIKTQYDVINNVKMISHTRTGNVFGGGQGDMKKITGAGGVVEAVGFEQGHCRTTTVDISGTPTILSSVFGGSEQGAVWGDAKVIISGGTIGQEGLTSDSLKYENGQWIILDNHATYSYGSVFGGSYGMDSYTQLGISDPTVVDTVNAHAGRVYRNTYVNITGGAVRGNVYGGGNMASVGEWTKDLDDHDNVIGLTPDAKTGKATVSVSGSAIIGPLDMTGLNAYVFGGGKGIGDDPNELQKLYGNVNSTKVTVDLDYSDDGDDTNDGHVWGSLFGGGSDGHVLGNAEVNLEGGHIGTTGETTWDGNIFGGGRNFRATNETAGRVGGNITVNVIEGEMLGSIFGGGRLGSVGIDVNGEMQSGDSHGFTFVNVGGNEQTGEILIGHTAYNDHDRVGGNVYGGGKGISGASTTIYPNLAKVKQSEVNIREKSGEETWIEGSVFGSGEDGHVLQDTYVNIYGGQIGGHDYGDLEPCEDPYHGNVYGGGRGLDTYEVTDPVTGETSQHYSKTAGIVQGNANVTIKGGHIVRNVYGGGNLASVGTYTYYIDPNTNEVTDIIVDVMSGTGDANVTINGGTIGWTHEDQEYGNVFGSSHGGVGGEFVHLAFVNQTHVTIDSIAQIYGSVFGGGEDGHVREHTLVDVQGGTVGSAEDNNLYNGNVYGGGRGITSGDSGSAGEVYGHTTVNIQKSGSHNGTYYTPIIYRNVFGGGSASVVHEYKVVNISDGLVKGNVFGGSRAIPANRENKAPRWVNMWGGTVEQDLYGCSYQGIDGDPTTGHEKDWASFVNLSGGTIGKVVGEDVSGGNVYGAGYGDKVKGSVAVLIGQNAIVETSNQSGDEFYDINVHRPTTPAIANLDIKGSVFGGSYGSIGSTDWEHSFNVSGYSRVYIDGTGYNTTISAPAQNVSNYMNIGGGVYGCGTNCESGEEGRNILIRNYGTRNHTSNTPDAELTEASRTLTTVQRGDIILFDNTNVNLSGAADISQSDSDRAFAVLQVDKGVYVTNASGIVLGAVGAPAYMDSIHEVRSLHLKPNTGTSYDQINGGDNANWEWIGVDSIPNQNNTPENARLYYTQTASTTPLEYNQENVIIFNGDSRLYVRYLDKTGGNKKRMYGELQGFFRMRAEYFNPVGTESFAYARPKVTPKNNPIEIAGFDNAVDTRNEGDGGFLSYNTGYNYFTQNGQEVLYYTYHTDGDDGGIRFTKTKQYPYFNIGEYVQSKESSEMDMEEFREWVLPTITGQVWYVDGRGIGNGGWGKDDYHQLKWGHFPDMPKKTITGELGIYYDRNDSSHEPVYNDFSQADDIIYVVGPIEAINELDTLNRETNHQLKLYRYPGGHKMSNNHNDETVVDSEHPAPIPSNLYNGLVNENESSTMESNKGPGANLGMMIHANKAKFVMENVLVDGLYTYSNGDITVHYIPTSYATQKLKVDKPMVVTTPNTQLTLKGFKTTTNTSGADEIVTNGTILQRGYNGTDAVDTWYYDSDYVPSGNVHHGGALYVDENATVNVEGLVSITGNLQKKGEDGTVPCNVYLPTFEKHLGITNVLNAESEIGVTSPKRNNGRNYLFNTLSPVAVANKSDAMAEENSNIALDAWEHCYFRDDQGWFFVNENSPTSKRTTYRGGRDEHFNTLYFGWTWANVVRCNPGTSSYEELNDEKTIKIKDEKGLAWLISKTSGMNGQNPVTDFSDTTILLTNDISLKKYVWVPIGDTVRNCKPFAGHFDGQGHIIDSLCIDFIGKGDSIYERHNYGMFGYVNGGSVDRTFVVSGKINPVIASADAFSIGGLVGCLEGINAVVSNSEAAVDIHCPNVSGENIISGGLVAKMVSGEIHSSMAMSIMNVDDNYTGPVGGLVGLSKAGQINNSFVNATFIITDNNGSEKIGGLLGENENAWMKNCYVNLYHSRATSRFVNDSIVAVNPILINKDNIDSCYVIGNYAIKDHCGDSCGQFTLAMDADKLGYMYADNRVSYKEQTGRGFTVKQDTTMFMVLNRWVDKHNKTGHKYGRWARPGLQEINGDLPVLLLSEFDGEKAHQGGFRSMGTYAGGDVLQYGGPARDSVGSDLHEVDSALIRPNASNLADYLFIYGDVSEEIDFDGQPTQGKVSIYEHASIKSAGDLANFENTYVGITFDNSKRSAQSTPGINDGIVGMGGFLLPRDWHMMSTPLSNAPLGFNYCLNDADKTSTNVNTYPPAGGSNQGLYYKNPWVDQYKYEFSWLNGGAMYGNKRYWMKGWENSQSPNQPSSFIEGEWEDGYFPSSLSSLHGFGTGCIESADEYGRYPYGMDFYTWYEPQYHWINFKRNGPNHWHSDPPHEHLDYFGSAKNVNEEELIPGRGYMASISVPTFLQSHGLLNASNSSIKITREGANCQGWNLVGNPYHGYLDFNEFAASTDGNGGILSNNQSQVGGTGEVPFYVIYNADSCAVGQHKNGFLYYPVGGSKNGAYAGRYIHPHQGFFVLAKEESVTPGHPQDLIFKEGMIAMRSEVKDDGFFRDWQPSYPLVNLFLSSDHGCQDITVVEFERPEWGGATKLRELRQGNGLFYGYHDEHSYAAIFAQEGATRVPLWFEAKEDDIFTMKWNTANGDFNSLYLIDNILGVQYDMLANNTYTFEGHKEDYKARFYIVFDVTGVEEEFEQNIFAFFDGSQWVVTGEGELDLVDMQGRVLWHEKLSGGQSRLAFPTLAKSMYLLRLTNSRETKVQKIIVQ